MRFICQMFPQTNYSHDAEKTKKDWCGLETDITGVLTWTWTCNGISILTERKTCLLSIQVSTNKENLQNSNLDFISPPELKGNIPNCVNLACLYTDVAASLNLICCYLGNVSDTDKTFPGLCTESTSDAFSCAFLEGRMRRKEVLLREMAVNHSKQWQHLC